MNIKMIVSDLDGTLLRQDKTLSDYTLRVLRDCRLRGIPFVIATARPVRAVKQWLPFLEFDSAIYHNGAVLQYEGEFLPGFGIEKPGRLIEKFLAYDSGLGICAEIGDCLYANFDTSVIWKDVPHIRTDFSDIPKLPADKLLLKAATPEERDRYAALLPPELYAQISENTITMIMNRQATKLSAIRRIAQAYGVPLSQVAAFGDDYNDVEMLSGCGYGVAVENAIPEAGRAAGWRCGSNERDGAARWLAKHVLEEDVPEEDALKEDVLEEDES